MAYSIGDTISVREINREHPDYAAQKNTWRNISLIYASGDVLRASADTFLARRPKELPDVYNTRLAMFTHVNHLGTALDWYCSTLFGNDPAVLPVATKSGISAEGKAKLDPEDQKFYDAFFVDCNKAGVSFVDIFRSAFQNLLLYQNAYVLMDLPATPETPYPNLDSQKKAGALDPYVCVYSPLEVINWDLDSYGNLTWAVIHVTTRDSKTRQDAALVDRWYYYDKTNFEVWQRARKENEFVPPPDGVATLVSFGAHTLAKYNKVPIQRLQVPEGLWLANRAYLAAVAHLNIDNVLQFAITMSALAMPIIFCDEDVAITLSEAGSIKLPQNAKYEWTEPEGKSYDHLQKRLMDLTENIFRSFYLIQQGRSGRSTPTAQSGVSKQMDMMPSKDILKMFGDLVRSLMLRTMTMIAESRGDGITWDVRGFDFSEGIPLEDVQALQGLLLLGITSPRFEKEVYKQIVKCVLKDADPATMRTICEEIDAAPAKEDRDNAALKKKIDILGGPGAPGAPKVPSVTANQNQ